MTTTHDHIHSSLQHLAVAVDSLTPDPKNARKHDRRNLDAIKASLEKFGFRQPVIVQQQGMIVRAGNGRIIAARELGWSHVPALVVDESEADAVAYAIADNRTAELAEWDWEHLSASLEELGLAGFDVNSVGFDESEVEALLQPLRLGDAFQPQSLDDDEENPLEDGDSRRRVFSVRVTVTSEDERQAILSELKERGFNCKAV